MMCCEGREDEIRIVKRTQLCTLAFSVDVRAASCDFLQENEQLINYYIQGI